MALRRGRWVARGVRLFAAVLVLTGSASAEVDFYAEFAALPATQAAIAVAAEGSALEIVAEATEGVAITPRNQSDLNRLTDLVKRQTQAALTEMARSRIAVAMSEEQAAALVDLHATPDGAALIEATMLAILALRQEGAEIAAFELERADLLLRNIRP